LPRASDVTKISRTKKSTFIRKPKYLFRLIGAESAEVKGKTKQTSPSAQSDFIVSEVFTAFLHALLFGCGRQLFNAKDSHLLNCGHG
jgi:hypothetical protein